MFSLSIGDNFTWIPQLFLDVWNYWVDWLRGSPTFVWKYMWECVCACMYSIFTGVKLVSSTTATAKITNEGNRKSLADYLCTANKRLGICLHMYNYEHVSDSRQKSTTWTLHESAGWAMGTALIRATGATQCLAKVTNRAFQTNSVGRSGRSLG